SAENVAEYCKKGSLVGITGRIQTRNYDEEQGKRIYRTEVVIESITFLERRREGAS
ncbi:single-stranded DNA-binding protein, partial [Bacillus cereus]|nr:single-stranded DNA-binding protein [Bacillus cereus]